MFQIYGLAEFTRRDVAGVFEVLKNSPLIEHTTLEVAGDEAMLKSYEYLTALGAE